MYENLQEKLVYEFKCLCLTNCAAITYGAETIHNSVYQEKSIGEPLLVRTNSLIHEPTPIINASVTAREIVLRRCGQTEPLPFEECYTPQ